MGIVISVALIIFLAYTLCQVKWDTGQSIQEVHHHHETTNQVTHFYEGPSCVEVEERSLSSPDGQRLDARRTRAWR